MWLFMTGYSTQWLCYAQCKLQCHANHADDTTFYMYCVSGIMEVYAI